jgi:hypothetical protein
MVAASEPSHTTIEAARPWQQEDVATAAAQAPATRDPHQGRGRAHAESRGARGCGAAETLDGGDPPRGGRTGVVVGSAPGLAPGVLVVRSDGCVMSQQPALDAGVSTSRVAAPAPDTVSS